jgi:hypothetical protein
MVSNFCLTQLDDQESKKWGNSGFRRRRNTAVQVFGGSMSRGHGWAICSRTDQSIEHIHLVVPLFAPHIRSIDWQCVFAGVRLSSFENSFWFGFCHRIIFVVVHDTLVTQHRRCWLNVHNLNWGFATPTQGAALQFPWIDQTPRTTSFRASPYKIPANSAEAIASIPPAEMT